MSWFKAMMNYQKFRGDFSGRRKYIVFALFAMGVLALDIVLPTFLPAIFLFVAKPFWKAGDGLTGAASARLFSSKAEVLSVNRELRSRIIDAELRLKTLKALQEENTALKKLLGRDGERVAIAAAVLSRPPFSPYDTFIIDAGKALGVEVGDLAVFAGAHLIGEITEVGITYAKVKLFSSPNVKTAILVGDANIQAEALGQGGGAFLARLPKGVSVSEGDAVTMPSFNLGIYGFVERVVADETDTFQKIYFRSSVSISEVRFVGVERREILSDVLEPEEN